MALTARLRELMKKYGAVAIGVHFSVSAVSITGFYVAIKNNVDVNSIFEKVGLSSGVPEKEPSASSPSSGGGGGGGGGGWGNEVVLDDHESPPPREDQKKRSRTAELAASSGGAFALAILCNKALLPIRVPITIALTPPVARFLARRNLIKKHV